MKFLQQYRSAGLIAALATLLLFSGNASAIPVNANIVIGGFANGGSLSVFISGNTGTNDLLEEPALDGDFLGDFLATYDDDGAVGPIVWNWLDLVGGGSLVYNASTGILESLLVLNFYPNPNPNSDFDISFELSVGDSVLDPEHYVEIVDLFTGLELSSREFPGTGTVPVPGTVLLLSLGLLLLRKRLS